MSDHGTALGSYSVGQCAKKGARDGSPWKWSLWPPFRHKNVPSPTLSLPWPAPFWETLRLDAQETMERRKQKWTDNSQELQKSLSASFVIYEASVQDYERELAEANEAQPKQGEPGKAAKVLAAPALSRHSTRFVLLMLGAGEVVFNCVIFQLLGENMVSTVLLSAAIGVVFPFLGHFIGHHIKQNQVSVKDRVLVGTFLLTAIAGLLAVAFFRGYFLESGDMNEFLGIKAPLSVVRNLFFVINLVLLAGSIAASYMGTAREHDAYTRLCREVGEAKEAGTAADLARKALEEQISDLRGLREGCVAAIAGIESHYGACAAAYREANLRSRAQESEKTPQSDSHDSARDCFTKPQEDGRADARRVCAPMDAVRPEGFRTETAEGAPKDAPHPLGVYEEKYKELLFRHESCKRGIVLELKKAPPTGGGPESDQQA